MTSVMGTRMLRKEDPALLTGENKFIDDIHAPGELWMGMIRSTMAHAKINGIDTSEAEQMPGVAAVYTGEQLAEMGLWAAPLPCAWPVTEDMVNPPHNPVCVGEAKHVGDIVAVVLADSRYGAADAAEKVVVDYEPLPAVASIEEAVAGEKMAHSDLESNKAFHWPLIPDPEGTEKAFAEAAHVVKAKFVQQRLIPSAMEPRGCLAVPSPAGGEITFYSATQVPHILKVMIAATTGIPESKIRVIAPVGRRWLRRQAQRRRRRNPVRHARQPSRCASSLDRNPHRGSRVRPTRAEVRSSTWRWPPTRTARSTRCGCTSTPTWART